MGSYFQRGVTVPQEEEEMPQMLHFPKEDSAHRNLPCTHTERHIYSQNPILLVLIFNFPTALLAVSDICTPGSCSLEYFQLTQLVVAAFQSLSLPKAQIT